MTAKIRALPALVAFLALLAALIGCETAADDGLPCVISQPRARVAEREGYYSFAGIEFDFANLSQKTVAEFSISCFIYPLEDHASFVKGTNHITASVRANVAPGRRETFAVSIDGALATIPEEGFLIDFFTVTKMTFDDGTSVSDSSLRYWTRNF